MKDGKTVSEGNTLNLKATRNQTGEYWCWADNGIGKAVKTGVHLDVQCKYHNKYSGVYLEPSESRPRRTFVITKLMANFNSFQISIKIYHVCSMLR